MLREDQCFKDNEQSELRVNRRELLKISTSTAAALCLSNLAISSSAISSEPSQPAHDRLEIWDSHIHLSAFAGSTAAAKVDSLLSYADRMGISRSIIFMGWPWAVEPSPEQVRRENDQVLEALKHAPDQLLGYVYINPTDVEGSLAEIRRCVEDGPMVGIKLWVAGRCHEDYTNPIAELATRLNAVVYQHTWMKTTGNLAGESTPEDLLQLSRRHPECKLICGHSGGNWELGLRIAKQSPSLMFEIAGADPTAGITERSVKTLGANRVIYGSDAGGRSLATQLGKIAGADITDEQKKLILAGNIKSMLRPIMLQKGMKLS